MTERPDLDAIGGKLVNWEQHTMGQYESWCEELLTVVRYCRELEAENKRLWKVYHAKNEMLDNLRLSQPNA